MGGGPGKGIGEKRERRFDGLAMRSLRRRARRCDSYGYRGGVSTAVETSRNRRRDETRPAARDQQEGLNDTHGSRRARIAALGTMAERSFLSLSVSQSLSLSVPCIWDLVHHNIAHSGEIPVQELYHLSPGDHLVRVRRQAQSNPRARSHPMPTPPGR